MKIKQFNRAVGNHGEALATRHLENNGYKIRARQFRIKEAEIDIIAEKNGVIVFVEVKARRDFTYGQPSQAVKAGKQQKIIRAAEYYIMRENLGGRPCRFDVIEVILPQNGDIFINQIENAFEAQNPY